MDSRAGVLTVTSPKGGVGKTACAYITGAALAERRGLRVIAVDADHDVGTLTLLLPGDARTHRSARHLLGALDQIDSAEALAPYVSVDPSGLHVLGGPFGPADRPQETARNLAAVVDLLERFYDIIVLDLGTGLAHPVIRLGIQRADHVLMLTGPDRVGASRVESALRKLLDRDGRTRLPSERITLVLNRVTDIGDAAAMIETFRRTGVGLDVAIPHDDGLAAMLDTGTFDMEALVPETRIAVRELALSAMAGAEAPATAVATGRPS